MTVAPLLTPISSDDDYHIACYFHDNLTERFSHWKIKFDMTTFELKQYTHILQHGWNIYYQFGNDINGHFIEVYTSHRMTSDEHFKLYEDGTLTSLPAFSYTYIKGEEHITDEHNNKVKHDVYDPEHGILRTI